MDTQDNSCECEYYPTNMIDKYYSVTTTYLEQEIIRIFSRMDIAMEWIRANELTNFILNDFYSKPVTFKCYKCNHTFITEWRTYSLPMDDLTPLYKLTKN